MIRTVALLGEGCVTAQVLKDVLIGEAEAKRDAGIMDTKSMQEKVSVQYLSETEMAKAQCN